MGKDIVNGRTNIIMAILLLLVSISAAAQGWTVRRILLMNERIVTMEANRFTAMDGLEVWKEINSIRAGMK